MGRRAAQPRRGRGATARPCQSGPSFTCTTQAAEARDIREEAARGGLTEEALQKEEEVIRVMAVATQSAIAECKEEIRSASDARVEARQAVERGGLGPRRRKRRGRSEEEEGDDEGDDGEEGDGGGGGGGDDIADASVFTRADALLANEKLRDTIEAIRASLLKQLPRVIDLFRGFDANGDGKVSRAEWRQALPLLVDLPTLRLPAPPDPLRMGAAPPDQGKGDATMGGGGGAVGGAVGGAAGNGSGGERGGERSGERKEEEEAVVQARREAESRAAGMDALFDAIDFDGSGSMEFKEMEKVLRKGADVTLAAELRDGAQGEIETEAKLRSVEEVKEARRLERDAERRRQRRERSPLRHESASLRTMAVTISALADEHLAFSAEPEFAQASSAVPAYTPHRPHGSRSWRELHPDERFVTSGLLPPIESLGPQPTGSCILPVHLARPKEELPAPRSPRRNHMRRPLKDRRGEWMVHPNDDLEVQVGLMAANAAYTKLSKAQGMQRPSSPPFGVEVRTAEAVAAAQEEEAAAAEAREEEVSVAEVIGLGDGLAHEARLNSPRLLSPRLHAGRGDADADADAESEMGLWRRGSPTGASVGWEPTHEAGRGFRGDAGARTLGGGSHVRPKSRMEAASWRHESMVVASEEREDAGLLKWRMGRREFKIDPKLVERRSARAAAKYTAVTTPRVPRGRDMFFLPEVRQRAAAGAAGRQSPFSPGDALDGSHEPYKSQEEAGERRTLL